MDSVITKGRSQLTQEWMLKTLLDLGFPHQDAEIYVFLALNGSRRAKDLTNAMKTYKRQVYRTLKRLQNRQIVTATTSLPAQFSAIPFDKVLDMLIKANMEEANRVERKKDKMLALWKRSVKGNPAI